ncbi:MAG: hypothetical protein M3297_08360, partial [Thermoproteota archaeon]|nr:hypothetical protein [Thermoproteota archaeon]
MQISTITRAAFYGRESWIVFLVTVVTGLSAAFVLYSLDRFSLLYYADAVSHLVRSREFVDAINPGLFEQLGTVWLPLPHLLLLPFTLIEPLFRTGFAGVALNVPCLAFTAVFLYKIIKNHLSIGYIAIIGALLFVTNPNILYLAVTPMTEASFMLFFVGAAYFFMRWMSGTKEYLSLNPMNEGGQGSHVIFNLIMCSTFISLATLCRYEGWLLPLFLLSFVVLTTIRTQRYYHSKKYKVGIILTSTFSFSGIALWLIWNAYAYNDPLEFTNAPYFSAAAQALEGANREFLYLQPWNVASLYGITALAIFGPILLAAAVIGYLFHRYLGKIQEREKRRNLYLFLALPSIFTIITLIIGIGEMNQREWFNSRFVILLAPLIVSLCCIFLAKLLGVFKKNRYFFAATIFMFFAYQLLTPALGVVTFLNANYQYDEGRSFQIQAAEALATSYDGSSNIVIITGSSQQNMIMHASGIPLRQFDQILESGSYKASFKDPWIYSRYIV